MRLVSLMFYLRFSYVAIPKWQLISLLMVASRVWSSADLLTHMFRHCLLWLHFKPHFLFPFGLKSAVDFEDMSTTGNQMSIFRSICFCVMRQLYANGGQSTSSVCERQTILSTYDTGVVSNAHPLIGLVMTSRPGP
jgi:hypothetical protein